MDEIKIKNLSGFTLLELLVTVAIIGMLAAIVLVSVSAARVKARDAKRASDMHAIYAALNLYYDKNGCLPKTSGSVCPGATVYSDANAGGWDYSSQGGFLGFLAADGELGQVPLDPVNNMSGDGLPAGTYSYKYYCYPNGSANPGLHLAYWKENGGYTIVNVRGSGGWTDPGFTCK